MKDKKLDNKLDKYSDHHCKLIKKYRTLFHYVWLLEEVDGNRFKVYVGRDLYYKTNMGTPLTVGRINRKLVNIRRGFCKPDK